MRGEINYKFTLANTTWWTINRRIAIRAVEHPVSRAHCYNKAFLEGHFLSDTPYFYKSKYTLIPSIKKSYARRLIMKHFVPSTVKKYIKMTNGALVSVWDIMTPHTACVLNHKHWTIPT